VQRAGEACALGIGFGRIGSARAVRNRLTRMWAEPAGRGLAPADCNLRAGIMAERVATFVLVS
jgi:hypothetical protein